MTLSLDDVNVLQRAVPVRRNRTTPENSSSRIEMILKNTIDERGESDSVRYDDWKLYGFVPGKRIGGDHSDYRM